MKIACLFDGAGLSRLGLELAGHDVTGYELDPWKHYLGLSVGSGNTILADAAKVDLRSYDGVWLSPPCQVRSDARTQGPPISDFAGDFIEWSLSLSHETLWVENVTCQSPSKNTWGRVWNAAQFLADPIQNRNRIVGGRYPEPVVFHPYRKAFPGICPCITASEYKGCATDARRASRYYGRRITIDEAAFRQGFKIPDAWRQIPDGFTVRDRKTGEQRPGTKTDWNNNLYEAIGNGVPIYMARAFGEAAI